MFKKYRGSFLLGAVVFALLAAVAFIPSYKYPTLTTKKISFAPSVLLKSGWRFLGTNTSPLGNGCNSLTTKDTTSGRGFVFIYSQTQTGCSGKTKNPEFNYLALVYNLLIAGLLAYLAVYLFGKLKKN